MEIFISNSREETVDIGKALGEKLKPSDVVAFRGELGSGKTCFTSGIALGLGYKGDVTSPTFALINEYLGGKFPLYHFDMYRISSWDELYSSGFFEYIDQGGVVAAEWSENIENALPQSTIYVEFEKLSDNSRKIKIWRKGEE